MSGRFLMLLLLLAALATAVTYFYTTERSETVSDPELTDLECRATLHGWPWGYYAEVTELVRYDESRVAVMEYKELYFEKLGQTYLAWFVALLVLGPVALIVAAPRQRRI